MFQRTFDRQENFEKSSFKTWLLLKNIPRSNFWGIALSSQSLRKLTFSTILVTIPSFELWKLALFLTKPRLFYFIFFSQKNQIWGGGAGEGISWFGQSSVEIEQKSRFSCRSIGFLTVLIYVFHIQHYKVNSQSAKVPVDGITQHLPKDLESTSTSILCKHVKSDSL